MKFYLGNSQQGSTLPTSGTSLYSGSAPLYLGALQSTTNGDNYFLDGYLDDVRLWNRARSASEMSTTMNRSLTGSEPGLVAYYPFEQPGMNLNDQTQNANTLTNNGSGNQVTAISTSLPFTGDTRAALFERAENDMLTAADSNSLNPSGSLTIEMWVKFQSLPNDLYVLVSKWGNYDYARQYYVGLLNNGNGTYGLHFAYSTDGSYQEANAVSIAWTPSLDVWYHVAVVFDASVPSVKWYVNGSQQGSTITSNTGTSLYTGGGTPLYLGAMKNNIGDICSFDGMLDDGKSVR